MSTKLNKIQISPEFENLFSFNSKDDKLDHKAQMISFRILSEIEKLCAEKKIKRKDLAEILGTSKSYVTQLFRGDRQINAITMAKLEDSLGFTFDVRIKMNNECDIDFLGKQLELGVLGKRKFYGNNGTFYYVQHEKDCIPYFVESMEQSEKQKQIAV